MENALQALLKFRNERDWEQFHNPKDLALAINIEAGELLELYLWKDAEEAKKERLKECIFNIYKTMMLRGIKGTYVYVCDFGLREYFKNHLLTQ